MKSYSATLDFLYSQLPMFQRIGPAAMKKDLGNIRVLLDYLGNPEKKFASIHIAGTNGKGSVSHILGAALMAAGWKTGFYTSPHYVDFRERIKINGELISKRKVVAFVQQHQAFIEELRPSFFEITVAMAFQHFAEEGVGIAIVETGLGGRLDSTNVLNPLLSVITNIGWDHQQFLGDTLPQIAGEKAGIIKKGTPVVIGETQSEDISAVFRRKADQEGAPLIFADQLYEAEVVKQDFSGMQLRFRESGKTIIDQLDSDLSGPYQPRNFCTAFGALDTLGNMYPDRRISPDILPDAWKEIKSSTHFLGRWQVMGESPLILADSAHNKDGLELVMTALDKLPRKKLHIVLGMVADKDHAPVLQLFPKEAKYYFAKADIPRGLDAEQLRQAAGGQGLKGKSYSSIRRALAAAKKSAQPEDLIFVGGSIFTVAEVVGL